MNKTAQRKIAFTFGVVFVVAIIMLAIVFPQPTAFQYTVFRIVLALAAAGIASMIPGFLELAVPGWVRASGGLAVFALVYFYNPASLVAPLNEGPPSGPRELQFVIIFQDNSHTYSTHMPLSVEGNHALRTVAERMIGAAQVSNQIPDHVDVDSLRPMPYESARWLDYNKPLSQLRRGERTVALVSQSLVTADPESAILYRPFIAIALEKRPT